MSVSVLKPTVVFEGQVCGPMGTNMYRVVKGKRWSDDGPDDMVVVEKQGPNDALGQPSWNRIEGSYSFEILTLVSILLHAR